MTSSEAQCSGEAWRPNFQAYSGCPAALLQTGGAFQCLTQAIHCQPPGASPHVVLCALLQLRLIVQQDLVDPAGVRLQAGQEAETAVLNAPPEVHQQKGSCMLLAWAHQQAGTAKTVCSRGAACQPACRRPETVRQGRQGQSAAGCHQPRCDTSWKRFRRPRPDSSGGRDPQCSCSKLP